MDREKKCEACEIDFITMVGGVTSLIRHTCNEKKGRSERTKIQGINGHVYTSSTQYYH